MKEFLDIITYFPGECIAIVIGVIGSIIAIAVSATERNKEQKKEGISPPRTLVIFMLVICAAILLIAFHRGKENPTTPTLQPTVSATKTTEKTEATESVPLPPKTICELQKSDFASVSASSTYNGDRATHIATNLIDGKRETNWTEGVDGNGVGQYVDFEFRKEQTITGFRICSGNHASDSYYTKNARPRVIKLTFEDGSSEKFTILDVMEELSFQLSEAVTTKTVRLTIEAVYEGDSWEDTVISEIVFLAEK